MRAPARLLVAALIATALLAAAPVARAQCMGPVQLDFGLEVERKGTYNAVLPSKVQTFLSRAECLYRPRDLWVRATRRANYMAYADNAPREFGVWIGGSCATSANRNGSPPACEKVKEAATDFGFFKVNISKDIRERVPFPSVFLPNAELKVDQDPCTAASSSNSLFFLFVENGKDPAEYCSLTLPWKTSLPSPPLNVVASGGDGAVALRWTAPPSDIPVNYQVLCGEEVRRDGVIVVEPIASRTAKLGYSTCYKDAAGNKVLERRADLEGTASGNTPDGGTSSGADMGAAIADPPPSAEAPSRIETSGDTTDGTEEFPGLDPKFLCSEIIDAKSTNARIEGLRNGAKYRFLVVGIDEFGNPSPAKNVVLAQPQPVEDLYRRFRDKGGAPQGFCFIATAAHGSYQSPYVKVLREFRDRALLPSASGRAFVAWYYRTSPPLARLIADHAPLRYLVRQLLWPLIAFAALWLLAAWQKLALVLALAGLVARRRRVPRRVAA